MGRMSGGEMEPEPQDPPFSVQPQRLYTLPGGGRRCKGCSDEGPVAVENGVSPSISGVGRSGERHEIVSFLGNLFWVWGFRAPPGRRNVSCTLDGRTEVQTRIGDGIR